MSNGLIYVVDAHFIDKIGEKNPGPKCLWLILIATSIMYLFVLKVLYKDVSTSQRFLKNESRNEAKIFVKSCDYFS
jgi:hypothetical protein